MSAIILLQQHSLLVDEKNNPSVAENSEKDNILHWKRYAFTKPLSLLCQISGYPNLLHLYSIFVCLAVSSASAERALSKLRIVKNRLRTTLTDQNLSALMVLAVEKDLFHMLNVDEVISRLADASPSLRAHLLSN